jgi:hypothetical protein
MRSKDNRHTWPLAGARNPQMVVDLIDKLYMLLWSRDPAYQNILLPNSVGNQDERLSIMKVKVGLSPSVDENVNMTWTIGFRGSTIS